MDHDTKVQTASTVGNTVAGVAVWQWTLNDWVAFLTLVYLVMQIVLLAPKYYKAWECFHKKFRKHRKG